MGVRVDLKFAFKGITSKITVFYSDFSDAFADLLSIQQASKLPLIAKAAQVSSRFEHCVTGSEFHVLDSHPEQRRNSA